MKPEASEACTHCDNNHNRGDYDRGDFDYDYDLNHDYLPEEVNPLRNLLEYKHQMCIFHHILRIKLYNLYQLNP